MGLAAPAYGPFWLGLNRSCINRRTPHHGRHQGSSRFFFWCVLCLKSLLNLLRYCFYLLVLWPWGMWDQPHNQRSSPYPRLEGEVLTTGLPGKLLSFCFAGKSRGCSGSRKYYGWHFWGYWMDDIPSVILFLTLTQWLLIHACYPSLSSRSLNTLLSLLTRIHWQMLEILFFSKEDRSKAENYQWLIKRAES